MTNPDSSVQKIQVDLRSDSVSRKLGETHAAGSVQERLHGLRNLLERCQDEMAALEIVAAEEKSESMGAGGTHTVACPDAPVGHSVSHVANWRVGDAEKRHEGDDKTGDPDTKVVVEAIAAEPLISETKLENKSLRLLVVDPKQLNHADSGAFGRIAFRVFVSLTLLAFFITVLLILPV